MPSVKVYQINLNNYIYFITMTDNSTILEILLSDIILYDPTYLPTYDNITHFTPFLIS